MDAIIRFCAQYLILLIGLLVIYTWYRTNKRREFVISVALALIIALILTKFAGALYFHPRPFVVEHIRPLIPHGPDNGFPSEHTVAAMTLTSVIFFYRKKFAAIALALTISVGAGRVAAHLHSPIDIIGGLIIGALAGYLGYIGCMQAMKRYFGQKSPQL
jgi:undecaprenyl-diphosphatase